MSFVVRFSAAARRDMERIPPRVIPAIIEFVYGDLPAEPHRVGKPLQRDLAGSFGARRGSYRILYEIDDATNTVEILRIDHRSDVFRPRS